MEGSLWKEAIGHTSVHCDSGSCAWGSGVCARARARCVVLSSSSEAAALTNLSSDDPVPEADAEKK